MEMSRVWLDRSGGYPDNVSIRLSRTEGEGVMNRRNALLLAAVIFLVGAPRLRAEVMYARTTTQVRSDRSLSSDVVITLRQGDAVNVLEQQGKHYRVRVGNREGWVYYNKLAKEMPEDVATLLAVRSGADGVRLTETEAGGALRGLAPTATKYAEGAQAPQWAVRCVEEMQEMRVTPKELDAFAREGRLGEYGEEK
jgi:hypothetical protein